jgi:transcriptional regulator with XRE-family HTH domain
MNGPDPILANFLKSLRLQRGVSQENLAFEADVTISTLSRIERGVTGPTWMSIVAIARVLKIGLDELAAAVMAEQRRIMPSPPSAHRVGLPPENWHGQQAHHDHRATLRPAP